MANFKNFSLHLQNNSHSHPLRNPSPLPLLWSQNPSQTHQDRISELPDEILHHILSFMSMQCAVQTSVLSKRWRHLWQYTDAVDFHTLPVSLENPADYSSITRCLNLHKALNVTRFSVVSHVGKSSNPDIMEWVDFTVSKGVKVLKIGLMVFTDRFPRLLTLPDSLYKNGTNSLQQLYLSCVDFICPRQIGFIGFPSLKILSLSHCGVGDRTIDLIVDNCLLLEVLIIDKCYGLLFVKINSPNLRLKEFVFSWSDLGIMLEVDVPSLQTLKYQGDLTKICLKNLHSLSQVVLIGKDNEVDETNIAHVRTLIDEIAKVKLFFANYWLLQFRCNFWDEFCGVVFVDRGEPEFVKLKGGMEKLNVKCLERLKSVEVISFSGFKGEMKLVRLLLQKAVMLEKLQFFSRPPGPILRNELQPVCHMISKTKSEIRRELLQEQVCSFPEASSHAQILFEAEHKKEQKKKLL